MEDLSELISWLFSVKYIWFILVFAIGIAIFLLKATVLGIVGAIMFGVLGSIFGDTAMIVGATFGFFSGFYGGLKGDG